MERVFSDATSTIAEKQAALDGLAVALDNAGKAEDQFAEQVAKAQATIAKNNNYADQINSLKDAMDGIAGDDAKARNVLAAWTAIPEKIRDSMATATPEIIIAMNTVDKVFADANATTAEKANALNVLVEALNNAGQAETSFADNVAKAQATIAKNDAFKDQVAEIKRLVDGGQIDAAIAYYEGLGKIGDNMATDIKTAPIITALYGIAEAGADVGAQAAAIEAFNAAVQNLSENGTTLSDMVEKAREKVAKDADYADQLRAMRDAGGALNA